MWARLLESLLVAPSATKGGSSSLIIVQDFVQRKSVVTRLTVSFAHPFADRSTALAEEQHGCHCMRSLCSARDQKHAKSMLKHGFDCKIENVPRCGRRAGLPESPGGLVRGPAREGGNSFRRTGRVLAGS